MKIEELITALRGLKVETGSLACLGCGYGKTFLTPNRFHNFLSEKTFSS